jgi:hypothetical protein
MAGIEPARTWDLEFHRLPQPHLHLWVGSVAHLPTETISLKQDFIFQGETTLFCTPREIRTPTLCVRSALHFHLCYRGKINIINKIYQESR